MLSFSVPLMFLHAKSLNSDFHLPLAHYFDGANAAIGLHPAHSRASLYCKLGSLSVRRLQYKYLTPSGDLALAGIVARQKSLHLGYWKKLG